MKLTPDARAVAAAPESVSMVAASATWSTRFFVMALGALLVAGIAVAHTWIITARYQREARLTYVKLATDGTWSLDQNVGETVDYFDATLRQVLYDWAERRYSKRKATILSDWGIAHTMLAPTLQNWFVNVFRASEVAAEHVACSTCDDTVLEVRAHQHLSELPRVIGEEDSEPFVTLLYASAREIPAGAVTPRAETRKLIKLQWRFLRKTTIQAHPELLRYNPIGVQVLAVEISDDTQP